MSLPKYVLPTPRKAAGLSARQRFFSFHGAWTTLPSLSSHRFGELELLGIGNDVKGPQVNDLKCSSRLNGAITNFAPMIGSIFSVIFFYNLTIPASGKCLEGFFFSVLFHWWSFSWKLNSMLAVITYKSLIVVHGIPFNVNGKTTIKIMMQLQLLYTETLKAVWNTAACHVSVSHEDLQHNTLKLAVVAWFYFCCYGLWHWKRGTTEQNS